MTNLWQYIALALGGLVLILGLSLWYTSGQLDDSRKDYSILSAEHEVLNITSSGLRDAIGKQNDKLKELANRRLEVDKGVAKVITKIDTKYITKYDAVKDLNESEECQTIKRIIDEDFNRTIN